MIGLAPSAMAQYGSKPTDVTVDQIAIKIGVMAPIDPTLRGVANQFIAAGLEYTFDQQFLPNSYTFLSAEWYGKSGSGGHGNLFPLTLNERFYFSAQRKQSMYVVGGVGAIFVDTGSSSDTSLALRGGVGLNLGPYIYTELDGFVGTPASGVHPSGLALFLGYRF